MKYLLLMLAAVGLTFSTVEAKHGGHGGAHSLPKYEKVQYVEQHGCRGHVYWGYGPSSPGIWGPSYGWGNYPYPYGGFYTPPPQFQVIIPIH